MRPEDSLEDKKHEKGEDSRALRYWLLGRALFGGALIAVLFLGDAGQAGDGGVGPGAIARRGLISLGALLILSSLFFSLLPRRAPRRMIIALSAVDLLLVAGLVYLTGGAGSVFASLYGVVILVSAVTLGAEAALLTTGVTFILHLSIALALSFELIPAPTALPPALYALDSVELSIALTGQLLALFIVGLLSRLLAARFRRASGSQQLAEASAERLEKRNASIVQSLSGGLLTLDAGGRIESANPAAERLLGISERELIGRNASELIDLPDELSLGERARFETTAGRADGARFPIGLTIGPLEDVDAGLSLLVFQDLSELHALEAKATRAERLAALGRVAAGLAHELRNPLGAISGSIELVRESARLDGDERRLLAIVSREVERLNDLASSMLLAAKPAAIELREFDLEASAHEVIELIERGNFSKADQTIELKAEAGTMARGDERLIRQLLFNLVKNALLAAPSGGRVEISLKPGPKGVEIFVDDDGEGIPEEAMTRVFEPFFSARPLGIGLGLSIVEQIVHAHGGEVEAARSPLGGARFRVYLPSRIDERAEGAMGGSSKEGVDDGVDTAVDEALKKPDLQASAPPDSGFDKGA